MTLNIFESVQKLLGNWFKHKIDSNSLNMLADLLEDSGKDGLGSEEKNGKPEQ